MKTASIKTIQIVLIFALALVMMLLVCNLVSPVKVVAHADDVVSSSTGNSFDESPVIDDLLSSTISGSEFNVINYPYAENQAAEIISLVEYCYSYRANEMDQYALYFYVYNPSGKKIETTGSRIQLATAWDSDWNPTEYRRFALEFCSKSEGEYAELFYKFKVNSEYFKNAMVKQSAERHYYISGIQLNYADSALAGTELTVAMTYTFTGFAKGYGPNAEESTLKCASSHMEEVLRLNVEDCFWRVDAASSLGKGHQDQINSVYFAVPRETLERYGTLYAVSAEWYEYKTKEILVTDDHNSDGMYYQIYKYLGVPVSDIPEEDTYSIISEYGRYVTPVNSAVTYYAYDWGFNYDAEEHSNPFLKKYAADECSELYYAFLVSDLDDDVVSGDAILQHIYDYTTKHPNDNKIKVGSKYMSANMFEDYVDAGHTRGYNYVHIDNSGEYDYDLRGYDSTHSKWDKWMDYGFTAIGADTSYSYDIQPIVEVDYSSINGLSTGAISENYLIDKSQVDEFKNYVQTYDDDYVTWLFRFSSTDYYSFSVHDMTGDAHGYVAQTTLFADFKVIDLTFVKDDIYTVIPVVQNPIDIIGGTTAPLEENVIDQIKEAFEKFKEEVSSWWDNLISSIKDFFADAADTLKKIGIVFACVAVATVIIVIVVSIVTKSRKSSSTSNTYNYYDHDKPHKNKSKRR